MPTDFGVFIAMDVFILVFAVLGMLGTRKFFIFPLLGAVIGMIFLPTISDGQIITQTAFSATFQNQTVSTYPLILIPGFETISCWAITLLKAVNRI